MAVPHKSYIQRLYRQALRTAFDYHAEQWSVYRQECLAIRERFEANRNETNIFRIQALVKETEDELTRKAHPRPFKFPTAPGGVKHGRNEVPPIWVVKYGEGNWNQKSDPIEWVKVN